MWLWQDIQSRLAAIRQAGLPTNGKELNDWYAAVPDARNSALVLTQAFAKIKIYPQADPRAKLVQDFKIPSGGRSPTAAQLELLRDFVQTNSAALTIAEEALKLPDCRYPVDFSFLAQTLLPHLADLDILAKAYAFRAMLTLASREPQSADADLGRILACAHTLEHEPCAISQLVRLKMFRLAVRVLEARLCAGDLSESEIATFAVEFNRTSVTNSVVRTLIGERAMWSACWRLNRAEAMRLFPARADEGGENKSSPLPGKGPLILKLAGYYDLDLGQFLLTMGTNITLASHGPADQLRAAAYFRRVAEGSEKRNRVLSSSTLSLYSSFLVRGVEMQAWQHLVTTALAIERYRNRQGRLPEKLEDLTPDFLAEVPADPFLEWRPLQYEAKGKSYVLYSVGRDRNDDGGLEEADKKESEDKKGYDLVFKVNRRE